MRNGAAALLVAAAGVAAFIGFGGHGGGGAGTAAPLTLPARRPRPRMPNPAAWGAAAGRRVVESFAFDPRNPQIVYVLTVGSSNGSRSRVFKTTDGGAHWQATATSGSGWVGGNEALTADPRHPGTLYAGTEVAVFKTVDGGNNWRPSKRGLFTPPRFFDRDKGWVLALAVDPANTNIVYAGSDRISKSTDGGHSWKTVSRRTPRATQQRTSPRLRSPPPAPRRSTRSRATSPIRRRHPLRTHLDLQVDRRRHDLAGNNSVRGSVALTALAVDPRHPTTVYAAIGANVLKTTDAGKTWQPIAHGLPIGDSRGSCHCVSR